MSDWQENNERVEELLSQARRSNQRARMACPLCADEGHKDRKLSLSINMLNGRWKCYRCQAWGKLTGFDDEDFDPRDEEADDPEIFEPPQEFFPLSGDRSRTLRAARKYLASRNLPEAMWDTLRIHACTSGFWAGRVIIPFLDPRAEDPDTAPWLGWIARMWKTPSPRAEGLAALPYLYPADMQKGVFFYNHNALFRRSKKPVLVVEGSFDAFPYWPRVVACLGKPSQKQISALKTAKRPVCICLDGDAWEEAYMLSCQLQFAGVQAGCIRLPAGYDPATVPPGRVTRAAIKSIGQLRPIRL